MSDFFASARYAFRVLRKNPGFTVSALAVLALGIEVDLANGAGLLAQPAGDRMEPGEDFHLRLPFFFFDGNGSCGSSRASAAGSEALPPSTSTKSTEHR